MSLRLEAKLNMSDKYPLVSSPLAEWQQFQLSEANSESEIECLLRAWYNNSYIDAVPGSFCDGFWDNVYCWPPVTAGSVTTIKCSDVLSKIHPQLAEQIDGEIEGVCLENGTWALSSKPVYDNCIHILEQQLKLLEEKSALVPIVQHLLFFGSLVSLLCLFITLGIFYSYRSLHCDRLTLQINLIFSLILRLSLMFFIVEPLVIGHQSSYLDVDILCEAVLVLYLYATFTTISWMFIQGLFLNITLMITANAVNTTLLYLRIYDFIGWVLPAVFVLAYVIAMGVKEQEKCWLGYSEMDEKWILLGPIAFELVVNALFLFNILRILIRKMRNSNRPTEESQIKAAAKATALLFPILGINNLFLFYNPGGEYNKYFVAVNTFFGSAQGVFVAIVYCFTNKDVLAAIKRSIQRAKARRSENFNQIENRERLHITLMLTQHPTAATHPCPSTPL